MLAHVAHKSSNVFLHCQYPEEEVTEDMTFDLPEGAHCIVCLMCAVGYVALLELGVIKQQITICDGLHNALYDWQDHICMSCNGPSTSVLVTSVVKGGSWM